jgi:phage I-like protein
LKPKQKKVRNSETLRDLLALVSNWPKRRRIGILPELGTVPAATTSEGLKSEAEEEHRRNKQISSVAKLPATNPSELKGEAATDLSIV